jgi:hypothetical protein
VEKQPFYFELEDQLKMFINAINGCIVNRYDRNRNTVSQVAVRYVYAPKQRALHDLVNKAQHITLPVVAFWVGGMQRDNSRVFNNLEGYDLTIGAVPHHTPQPVPVNIQINLSVLAKYQTDIDQIISNLTAYFDPYIMISWERFGKQFQEIRNKVIWSGSHQLGYPIDINENQPTRITLDTSFTLEGWIFKFDDQPAGLVRTIEMSFTALSSISNDIDFLVSQMGGAHTEFLSISGMPILRSAYPYAVLTDTEYSIDVYGTFLRGISAAYLSSGTVYPTSSSTLVDEFSAIQTLSADNPPFYGIPVEFEVLNDSNITITVPPALSAGTFDIIFLNKVGYGKLTDDTSSPYASGISVYLS